MKTDLILEFKLVSTLKQNNYFVEYEICASNRKYIKSDPYVYPSGGNGGCCGASSGLLLYVDWCCCCLPCLPPFWLFLPPFWLLFHCCCSYPPLFPLPFPFGALPPLLFPWRWYEGSKPFSSCFKIAFLFLFFAAPPWLLLFSFSASPLVSAPNTKSRFWLKKNLYFEAKM